MFRSRRMIVWYGLLLIGCTPKEDAKQPVDSPELFPTWFAELRRGSLEQNNSPEDVNLTTSVAYKNEAEGVVVVNFSETVGSATHNYAVVLGLKTNNLDESDALVDVREALKRENFMGSLYSGNFKSLEADFNGDTIPELVLDGVRNFRTDFQGELSVFTFSRKNDGYAFESVFKETVSYEAGICDGVIGNSANISVDKSDPKKPMLSVTRQSGYRNDSESCSDYEQAEFRTGYYWNEDIGSFVVTSGPSPDPFHLLSVLQANSYEADKQRSQDSESAYSTAIELLQYSKNSAVYNQRSMICSASCNARDEVILAFVDKGVWRVINASLNGKFAGELKLDENRRLVLTKDQELLNAGTVEAEYNFLLFLVEGNTKSTKIDIAAYGNDHCESEQYLFPERLALMQNGNKLWVEKIYEERTGTESGSICENFEVAVTGSERYVWNELTGRLEFDFGLTEIGEEDFATSVPSPFDTTSLSNLLTPVPAEWMIESKGEATEVRLPGLQPIVLDGMLISDTDGGDYSDKEGKFLSFDGVLNDNILVVSITGFEQGGMLFIESKTGAVFSTEAYIMRAVVFPNMRHIVFFVNDVVSEGGSIKIFTMSGPLQMESLTDYSYVGGNESPRLTGDFTVDYRSAANGRYKRLRIGGS
ncbi:MAG: hypothetical protein RIF36_00615 [Imperialibacter sp.]|uniref:hypothetical protein n=1 Tax=Imperialibacter sp. TaxID=2038411 RepID=UPI0032F012AE